MCVHGRLWASSSCCISVCVFFVPEWFPPLVFVSVCVSLLFVAPAPAAVGLCFDLYFCFVFLSFVLVSAEDRAGASSAREHALSLPCSSLLHQNP